MNKLIIKRSEWLRGEGAGCSQLFRSADGKRCCLGFLGNQLCGTTDAQLAGHAMPSDLPFVSWLPWMLETSYVDASITIGLAQVNDAIYDGVSDEAEARREDALTQRFAELNIQVEFVE